MHLGFNSNVRLADTVYHVQTEDRGPGHPFIDTTVYAEGRVLHRRTSSYQDLLGRAGFSPAALKERVERQHRSVIEELQAGALNLEPSAATPRAGIRLRLLNPAAWLVSGRATLELEVCEQATRRPVADVNLEVTLEGARSPARFAARTNSQGRAELSFLLPELGSGGAALVIRASSPDGADEIRYQLRSKPRASARQKSPE